ncbi:hypothetical protein [Streptomyces sp. NPDC002599]|uniref:hypothetical protein n=1 Tax=Streptomyces sp. NPDC002599 TaxID=3154421 RepID=UPI003321E86E
MLRTAVGRGRPLRRTAAVIGAVALTAVALAAAPASADRLPPGLVLAPLTPVAGVKPGSSFEVPATFANKGSKDLDKVWLSYNFSRGLAHQELPSNCERPSGESPGAPAVPADEDGLPGRHYVACVFDQTVKAGAVYAPERTLSLDVLGHALYEHADVMVSNYDPGAMTEGPSVDYVPGTGPAVKLIELPSTTPVGDGDRASGEGYYEYDSVGAPVTVVNTADFQVAARLTDRVGKTVTLEAKFTDAGPAWMMPEDGPATRILVEIPAGTAVTKAARYCRKADSNSYTCFPSNYYFVNENTTDTYTFTLRVDKKVAGAKASVALEAKARPFDKNKKNDTAAVLLDAGSGSGPTGGAGSTGGGSTGGSSTGGTGSTSSTGGSGSAATGGSGTGDSASTGSSGAPGPSTTGGDLASTGSGPALPLTAAAAAALVAGAGTVLLVRRRAARR